MNNKNSNNMAVVWPRQKVTLFSPWTPRFNPRAVYLGFVVDNVALGQVFLQVFWFSFISIISQTLHTHSPIANTKIILAIDSKWKYRYYHLHSFHNLAVSIWFTLSYMFWTTCSHLQLTALLNYTQNSHFTVIFTIPYLHSPLNTSYQIYSFCYYTCQTPLYYLLRPS